ncbi:hypothetical protein Mgra_00009501, partial [Meloidogyne graminicola]
MSNILIKLLILIVLFTSIYIDAFSKEQLEEIFKRSVEIGRTYIFRCTTKRNQMTEENFRPLEQIINDSAQHARAKISHLIIKSLEKYQVNYSSNEECPICGGELIQNIVKLGCEHYFHTICLANGLTNALHINNTEVNENSLFNCSLCRSLIKSYKIIDDGSSSNSSEYFYEVKFQTFSYILYANQKKHSHN